MWQSEKRHNKYNGCSHIYSSKCQVTWRYTQLLNRWRKMQNKLRILMGAWHQRRQVLLVLTLVTYAVHFGADVRLCQVWSCPWPQGWFNLMLYAPIYNYLISQALSFTKKGRQISWVVICAIWMQNFFLRESIFENTHKKKLTILHLLLKIINS